MALPYRTFSMATATKAKVTKATQEVATVVKAVKDLTGKEEDAKLKAQIKDWVDNAVAIKKLADELASIKKVNSKLEEAILPFIDEVLGGTTRVGNSIVRVKGRDQVSVSYKPAFEEALKKVNAATKKVLLDVKESFTKRGGIKKSLSVVTASDIDESLNEGLLSDVVNLFKNLLKRLNPFTRSVAALESLSFQVAQKKFFEGDDRECKIQRAIDMLL